MPENQAKINQIQIHKIAKTGGTMILVAGIKMMRSGYDSLVPIVKSYSFISDNILKIKQMPTGERDTSYYLTTKENLIECFNLIYDIVKNFKWQAEKFDCDDRAKLVSAFFSVLFGLNSCGECLCRVKSLSDSRYSGMHYNNIAVSQNREVLLFDVDNGGLYQEIKPNMPISFGYWSYELLSTRF